MSVRTLQIDGQLVSAHEGETVLQAAREAGIDIPTLCSMTGLSEWGGCRLCLVEVAGMSRPQPACLLKVSEGMQVVAHSPRLQQYRQMILELLLAERNHTCSVCVANGHCELQDRSAELGVDHVRFEYLYPECEVDLSHDLFGLDHHRCILCNRCLRVCDEVEGAHTWDVAGRGLSSRVISDMHQPWGDSSTCTSCGKCVVACPTGALFRQGASVAEMEKDRTRLLRVLQRRSQP